MKNEDQKKEVNLVCEPGIGFSQRDKNIKIQEEKGLFDFRVIKNTGENTPENLDRMKLLTDLKNIIINLKDPKGKDLYYKKFQQDVRVSLTATESGNYEMCIKNNDRSESKVHFEFFFTAQTANSVS